MVKTGIVLLQNQWKSVTESSSKNRKIKTLAQEPIIHDAKFATTLAILAGGKATRLGGINKALIVIEGTTIISRVYNTLKPLCSEVIIISNNKIDYGIPAKIYPDTIKNCGPLGGIYSALTHSSNDMVLVVSSDMPFIDYNIASELIETYTKNRSIVDIVIPTLNGFNEPLLAVYSKKLVQSLAEVLSDHKGHPTTDLIKVSRTIHIEIPNTLANQKSFTNINTFEDIPSI